MPRRAPLTLRRMVEWMARFCLPRHRELARGMVAELDAIADPDERRRFALGAMAAIARLAFRGYSQSVIHAPGRFVRAFPGGPSMSQLTTPQLLRRHAMPFAISFASLTLLLLANFAAQQLPRMLERGVSAGVITEMLLLAVPFTIALTIPMGVFLAVSWVFTRLGTEGVLASARQERHGVRRLIAPVLGAAAVLTALTLVSNTQVLPRTNTRLRAVLVGAPGQPTDRMMTIGQLREAASAARASTEADAARRAAGYEIEIQKKFALAAACLFLALAGAATAMRLYRGGMWMVLGASGLVFTGYWLSLVAGESLADKLLLSPLLAMWMANVFLLGVVLLLAWRPSGSGPSRDIETLAIGA